MYALIYCLIYLLLLNIIIFSLIKYNIEILI